jgi:hypothetical protein
MSWTASDSRTPFPHPPFFRKSPTEIRQGKGIWLRPGKKYLFGRTTPEGGRYGL